MRKQHIPDIEFDYFSLGQIKKLFDADKIYINKEYQRSDVWKPIQQIELINSIFSSYSMGILVLYINEDNKYEILDGQQRLLSVYKYVTDRLSLNKSELKKYSDLPDNVKDNLNGYSIFYLKLKSHNPETKEEDIVQTFLRLQEGSPLNKAEKINAHRGKFKETFVEIKETHPLFKLMKGDKRFRFRLLAAEMLLLELEGNFEKIVFPSLDINTFRLVLKKYQNHISNSKVKFFKGNLDYMFRSLNYLLTAITPRDLIPIYLLISYLRKNRAGNHDLESELNLFITDFLKQLNSFSIYDTHPPNGMSKKEFNKYLEYKTQARKATSSDSIEYRLDFFINEFKEKRKFIEKDKTRLHNIEQRRQLFLRQGGKCYECKKQIDFRVDGSAHHVIAHSKGGSTSDLSNSVLLHEKCHQKLEKKLKNSV